MTMIVYAVAAAILTLVLACVAALAAVVGGARLEERELRAQGCTCEYPRMGDHEGPCPMRAAS